MQNPEDTIRLQHMLDAAQKALAFTQGRSREDFDTDEMMALAVVRLIEIIGEAAKNVSQEVQQSHPNIQWRQIKGTRDRLAHAYFDVDFDIVWAIVSNGLKPLVQNLEEILAKGQPDL